MSPPIALKRLVKKSKGKRERLESALGTTGAFDANSRPVTRSEFQDLVASVKLLHKQCQRQTFNEAQIRSELEIFGAEVASNKTTLGELAHAVLEKTHQMQEVITKQMQHLQVESDRRLTEMHLALERLDFRFKHQIRECQSIAEQVDVHRDGLQYCKSRLAQMQLALDKQVESQEAFIETARYTVNATDARVKTIASECFSSLDAFQQRMITFVKAIEESTQRKTVIGRCGVAQTRDLEIQGRRYKNLLYQHLDEQMNMQQAVVECEAKLSRQNAYLGESRHYHQETTQRFEAIEDRVSKLLIVTECGVSRGEMEEWVDSLASHSTTACCIFICSSRCCGTLQPLSINEGAQSDR